jgi:hypothetical protein
MAEVAWLASLAWLERAAVEAREVADSRFRAFPEGELSRLRHELAGALSLARFAVAARRADEDLVAELTREAREAAADAGRARRREQTREAERVRLLRARCRREGREPTAAELYGWSAGENGAVAS